MSKLYKSILEPEAAKIKRKYEVCGVEMTCSPLYFIMVNTILSKDVKENDLFGERNLSLFLKKRYMWEKLQMTLDN